MKNLRGKFELWYKLTHWMAPTLARKSDGAEYIEPIVQAMYISYRAGYNKALKDMKEKR